jgi:hypothetical protein
MIGTLLQKEKKKKKIKKGTFFVYLNKLQSLQMAFTPAALSKLFIFTPKDVPEGKEEEKILYFYPPDSSIYLQVKYVGLSEGLVNFTRYL